MKIPLLVILILIVAALVFTFVRQDTKTLTVPKPNTPANVTNTPADSPLTRVIAEGLDTPWSLVFLPDNTILITERPGRVRKINSQGTLEKTPVATLTQVEEIGEGGLLGIEKDPDFDSNNYLYLYYTYNGSANPTLNRVSRFTYTGTSLKDEKVLIDAIPGNSNHNGGRIKFGPDGYLYITTGDAEEPSRAQDKNSLAGKILRITKNGAAAPGNPFGTRVYSYGHRNPQGITWTDKGVLYETEHGPSGGDFGTGRDELNLIDSGKNYGWSTIIGNDTRAGMVTPLKNSGTGTWAPGGIAFLNGSLFFGGLRGSALYESTISGNTVSNITEHFKDEFGRIRDVIVGPDNMLYITTSNNDGRGIPKIGDDKVIRVNPTKL